MSTSPAFGQADMTNCERELIHLAGSIQPHGLLLVLREPQMRVVQASLSAGRMLGRPMDGLLMSGVDDLDMDLCRRLQALVKETDLLDPHPLQCIVEGLRFEGAVHRCGADTLVLELEPVDAQPQATDCVQIDGAVLLQRLGVTVQRFSEASSIGTLTDSVVQCVRDIVGYDRVMVYRFDPDGHGKIIAEARDPRLEPLLGHRYPATDIPQRARELYLRNRVRVLVDVHYEPSVLVPRLLPEGSAHTEGELDMSLCYLRSMSPLHLQYLMNMGVTATLVVSLVREGKLWGLIACHHYAPRNVPYAVRAACELLGEAISTRIAAIENYARAQVAIQVRRLEQRLIEATSTEGDWRLARNTSATRMMAFGPMRPTWAGSVACMAWGELDPSRPGLGGLRCGTGACQRFGRIAFGFGIVELLGATAAGQRRIELSLPALVLDLWAVHGHPAGIGIGNLRRVGTFEGARLVEGEVHRLLGLRAPITDAAQVVELALEAALQEGLEAAHQVLAAQLLLLPGVLEEGLVDEEAAVVVHHAVEQLAAFHRVRLHDRGDKVVLLEVEDLDLVPQLLEQVAEWPGRVHRPVGHVGIPVARHLVGFCLLYTSRCV